MLSGPPPSHAERTLAIGGAQEHLQLKRVTIKVTSGSDAGAELEVGATTRVIGSSDECDLVLQDGFTSRRHIELTPQADGIRVRDLKSRNGSFIGNVRFHDLTITESTTLSVGKTTLLISLKSDGLEVPLSNHSHFGAALGESVPMRAVFALLEHAAQTDVTVLLEGPSGTGKDILATSLHQVSPRSDGPLVVVDCGSIPENLIESELFGHEKGAFTGAGSTRQGAFEQADGGTLFLDEIGELPIEMQPRLLRALESRTFRRVGGSKTISTNARFVAATNRRLAESVRRGEFREDLYYRLNVVQVRVPPLSERAGDVPLLATQFLRRATHDENAELPPGLARVLTSHNWPGNARELRNVVERFATFNSTDPQLLFGAPQSIEPSKVPSSDGTSTAALSLERYFTLDYHEAKRQIIDELHRCLLPHVLDECDGNVSEAAKQLGIPRTSLHRMLKKLEELD